MLGKGSFGYVLGATYKHNSIEYPCALKVLAKSKCGDEKRSNQVMMEKKVLSLLTSRFTTSLIGSYQTPQLLVFIVEEYTYGDLLGVIYEVSEFQENGLPPSLVKFYMTSLVLGLSHIHSHGIVYRDLKPENIMLTRDGYIKFIDFGLSKVLPYTKCVAGISTTFDKTHTLCGSPEYLAPEIVCSIAYDKMVDIWALGVNLYEMFMLTTPFVCEEAPKNNDCEEVMKSLFTNIAMVNRIGLQLPQKWFKSVDYVTTSLLTELLQGDAKNRLGYADGTESILQHTFFDNIDINSINSGRYVPEYIPEKVTDYDPLTDLPGIKPFKGDQCIFKGF